MLGSYRRDTAVEFLPQEKVLPFAPGPSHSELSQGGAELVGECGQDAWRTKAWRGLTEFVTRSSHLQAIAVNTRAIGIVANALKARRSAHISMVHKFLLEDHLATTEQEPRTVTAPNLRPPLHHPRSSPPTRGTPSIGHGEGGTPLSGRPPFYPIVCQEAQLLAFQQQARRGPAWSSCACELNEKLPPSHPPVGAKACPAAEGGAKFQVNHRPLLTLNSNSTDPLLACTMDETMIAFHTRSNNSLLSKGQPPLALKHSRIWQPHLPKPKDVQLHTSVRIPSSASVQDPTQHQEGAMRTKAWRSLQLAVQFVFSHLAQIKLFHLAFRARNALHSPTSHPVSSGAPPLEPTPSPAQVLQLGNELFLPEVLTVMIC